MASQHNIVIKHAFGLADSITVSIHEGDVFLLFWNFVHCWHFWAFCTLLTLFHHFVHCWHFLTGSRRRSKLERLKAAEKERLGQKPPLAGMFWLLKVHHHHLASFLVKIWYGLSLIACSNWVLELVEERPHCIFWAEAKSSCDKIYQWLIIIEINGWLLIFCHQCWFSAHWTQCLPTEQVLHQLQGWISTGRHLQTVRISKYLYLRIFWYKTLVSGHEYLLGGIFSIDSKFWLECFTNFMFM